MASTDGQVFRIEFSPGIHRQSTRYAEEGGWYDCDKIRFRNKRPENWRGWTRESQTQYIGKARKLITWSDNNGNPYAGIGTNAKLYVYQGGAWSDITPVTVSIHAVSAFSTQANSKNVYVQFANHGMVTGDYVRFVSASDPVDGGNLTLTGTQFTVASVTNNSRFRFTYTVSVQNTVTSVGTANIEALYPVGVSSASFNTGYGTGSYGSGGYGTGSGSVLTPLRRWSLDHFGQSLIASPSGGPIYIWTPPSQDHATLIANGPSQNKVVIIAPESRHVISMNCVDVVTSVYNPTEVQWSAIEDYTTWLPATTNDAGSVVIGIGSEIVGAIHGRNQILFWTNLSLHSMTYVGPPFTFQFAQLGDGCGLIGPNAAITFAGATYWMSSHNFFVFDGQIRDMDCSVLRYVFDDINLTQADKIYAGSNTEFSELIWMYCSKNSQEIDRYVLYDILDNAWSFGTINWTAWVDQGLFDTILATQWTDYRLYDVDVSGVFSADGQPMTCFVSSADFDIGDGNDLMFVDRIIPDFEFIGGAYNKVEMEAQFKKYPGATESSFKGPFLVSAGTSKISMRGRGRQAAIRVATSNAISGWRLGALRFNIQPDGKR